MGFFPPDGCQALKFPLGFFQASRASSEIAFLPILSASNDVAFALHAELQELGAIPQLRLGILRQLTNELTQSRRRKPCDKMQLFFAHSFQVDGTAHAVIKDKNRLLNTKAPLQGAQ